MQYYFLTGTGLPVAYGRLTFGVAQPARLSAASPGHSREALTIETAGPTALPIENTRIHSRRVAELSMEAPQHGSEAGTPRAVWGRRRTQPEPERGVRLAVTVPIGRHRPSDCAEAIHAQQPGGRRQVKGLVALRLAPALTLFSKSATGKRRLATAGSRSARLRTRTCSQATGGEESAARSFS